MLNMRLVKLTSKKTFKSHTLIINHVNELQEENEDLKARIKILEQDELAKPLAVRARGLEMKHYLAIRKAIIEKTLETGHTYDLVFIHPELLNTIKSEFDEELALSVMHSSKIGTGNLIIEGRTFIPNSCLVKDQYIITNAETINPLSTSNRQTPMTPEKTNEPVKYHCYDSCNKCSGNNDYDVTDSLDGRMMECKTKCRDCGFTSLLGAWLL